MKHPLVFLFAATVALCIACAVLLVTKRSAAQTTAASNSSPALTVKSTVATSQQWPQTLSAVGSIAAWQEVVIGAEISGQRLSRLLADVGDRVEQGQLLAQLNPGTLEADLNVSRAALQEAEVNAAEARRASDRARALQGTNFLSEQVIDQALAAGDAAQARLAAARARVQADTLRLAYTQVRAPDDGVISVRLAVEGALVQEGAEIMRLQRQGRLEWRAELPGPELARIAPGQTVRIAFGGTQSVEGRVRKISPQVDPQSRTGLVYVDLKSVPRVRAGLFARGEFLLDQHTVLTLPETAVLLRDGFSYVFRIEGDKVRQQKVALGARRGDRIEIREGLAADTAVVESGVGFLADGLTVRVVSTTPNRSPQPSPHGRSRL
ncbi:MULTISPECIES: efflux RND transporter periplasmic adaptor subunit [Enterobacteriaceae]|uniref:Efflux transporter, RND family, MFP subunit n=1 Tax=Klebsiella grimontii TaxID=2058152 RepID=A0A285BA61_9ENTR|nr:MULTISPECIES: efflux RND transporter periplasmic adaptor subunit [Enterobacteriaceae]MCF6689900.1 efflux RND transporter periplasmic adaptor subunit [Raoultella terrigena]MEB7601928.1 efflux RND transporter periplasmic adaptor subunit [Raoultella terrigena]MEB8081634.1 efflux RND transporter periplasmic adaptor subunit [Klebsiella michiganensis]MEB8160165.1 efflux RND transporter periplasmic adaptor subunit [Citrobacter braakii]SNU37792.1 Efflux transporter, RND family, MFP subunit [Klebsie